MSKERGRTSTGGMFINILSFILSGVVMLSFVYFAFLPEREAKQNIYDTYIDGEETLVKDIVKREGERGFIVTLKDTSELIVVYDKKGNIKEEGTINYYN